MAHRNRAEQFNVRKDPRKLARKTQRHTPKVKYKRQRNIMERYSDEIKTIT